MDVPMLKEESCRVRPSLFLAPLSFAEDCMS